MSRSEQELEIASLRELICKNFPAEKFDGMITPVDGKFTEELDEEEELYKALRNSKWPEIPASFIRANPDGFVLLADAAFVAFLPAWLIQCLDVSEENAVREYMAYTFSPKDDMVPDMTPNIVRRLRQLNSTQKTIVRSVLNYIVLHEPSKFIKNHAERAVAFIDHLNQQ